MEHIKLFPKIGVLEFSPFRNFPELTHGFTTREMGNTGLHVVKNQDQFNRAIKNRDITCRIFGIQFNQLVCAQQVHGDRIVPVNPRMRGLGAVDYQSGLPTCDGLITNYALVPMAIFVADCLPVFIFDPDKQAIGIIHAGRDGTQKEISRKAVEAMVSQYGTQPKNLLVVLGPGIGPCCFEIDLYNLNRRQLYQAGVDQNKIFSVDVCTACETDLFFSYRQEGDKAGRMMALIMLK